MAAIESVATASLVSVPRPRTEGLKRSKASRVSRRRVWPAISTRVKSPLDTENVLMAVFHRARFGQRAPMQGAVQGT